MENRQHRVISSILIVLITFACASVLRADVTGSILGEVRDRSQAVVAGARIVATNVEANVSQETSHPSRCRCTKAAEAR